MGERRPQPELVVNNKEVLKATDAHKEMPIERPKLHIVKDEQPAVAQAKVQSARERAMAAANEEAGIATAIVKRPEQELAIPKKSLFRRLKENVLGWFNKTSKEEKEENTTEMISKLQEPGAKEDLLSESDEQAFFAQADEDDSLQGSYDAAGRRIHQFNEDNFSVDSKKEDRLVQRGARRIKSEQHGWARKAAADERAYKKIDTLEITNDHPNVGKKLTEDEWFRQADHTATSSLNHGGMMAETKGLMHDIRKSHSQDEKLEATKKVLEKIKVPTKAKSISKPEKPKIKHIPPERNIKEDEARAHRTMIEIGHKLKDKQIDDLEPEITVEMEAEEPTEAEAKEVRNTVSKARMEQTKRNIEKIRASHERIKKDQAEKQLYQNLNGLVAAYNQSKESLNNKWLQDYALSHVSPVALTEDYLKEHEEAAKYLENKGVELDKLYAVLPALREYPKSTYFKVGKKNFHIGDTVTYSPDGGTEGTYTIFREARRRTDIDGVILRDEVTGNKFAVQGKSVERIKNNP